MLSLVLDVMVSGVLVSVIGIGIAFRLSMKEVKSFGNKTGN
jgi:hypothetical protein